MALHHVAWASMLLALRATIAVSMEPRLHMVALVQRWALVPVLVQVKMLVLVLVLVQGRVLVPVLVQVLAQVLVRVLAMENKVNSKRTATPQKIVSAGEMVSQP